MSDAVAITKSPGCGLFGSKSGFMTLALSFPRFDADGFCGIALRDTAGVGVGVGVRRLACFLFSVVVWEADVFE